MDLEKKGWLFLNLLIRDIHNRYSGGILGAGWLLFQPLLTLGIFYVVFSTIFKVRIPEADGVGFLAFVALGLWPWMAFQDALLKGTMAISGNAALVKKVSFPNELLVYSSIVSTYLVHVLGMLIVIIALHLFVMPLHLAFIPALLLLLGVMLLLTLALALFIAPLQVFFRDIDQFVAPLLAMAFYATPILYPARMVPDWLQNLLWLNPMTYFVERSRGMLLHGVVMFGWADLIMLLACVLIFWIAHRFFARLAGYFDDYL